jgi:hypothetical protein
MAVENKKPSGLREFAYKIKIITATLILISVLKFGQFDSLSGEKIIIEAAIKATTDIIYGNALGPKGSAKNGCSNCVALAKKASATTAIIRPKIRSDIIS